MSEMVSNGRVRQSAGVGRLVRRLERSTPMAVLSIRLGGLCAAENL